MAYEIPLFPLTLVAGADLSALQHYFVKLNTSGQAVAVTAVTDLSIGILQNNPVSGEEASIMVAGVSKVSSDEALTAGDTIGPSADGQADIKVDDTDTDEFVAGQVLTDSGAAGELATVCFSCLNPRVMA